MKLSKENLPQIIKEILDKETLEKSVISLKNNVLIFHFYPPNSFWGKIRHNMLIKKLVNNVIKQLNEKYGEKSVKEALKN